MRVPTCLVCEDQPTAERRRACSDWMGVERDGASTPPRRSARNHARRRLASDPKRHGRRAEHETGLSVERHIAVVSRRPMGRPPEIQLGDPVGVGEEVDLRDPRRRSGWRTIVATATRVGHSMVTQLALAARAPYGRRPQHASRASNTTRLPARRDPSVVISASTEMEGIRSRASSLTSMRPRSATAPSC